MHLLPGQKLWALAGCLGFSVVNDSSAGFVQGADEGLVPLEDFLDEVPAISL